MLKLYCKLAAWGVSMKKCLNDEKGSHTVEIVIFIAIAVGLAFIFRDKIAELIEKVIGGANQATDDLMKKPT